MRVTSEYKGVVGDYAVVRELLRLVFHAECGFSGVARETPAEAPASVLQQPQKSKTAPATAKAGKALPSVLSEASVMSVESVDDAHDLTGKTFTS